jgi:hypothetical protein
MHNDAMLLSVAARTLFGREASTTSRSRTGISGEKRLPIRSRSESFIAPTPGGSTTLVVSRLEPNAPSGVKTNAIPILCTERLLRNDISSRNHLASRMRHASHRLGLGGDWLSD